MGKHRFTSTEREVLFRAYKEKCFYCGRIIDSIKNLVVDHVIPERLIGTKRLEKIISECNLPDSWQMNSYANWVPYHLGCNASKGARILDTVRLIFVIEKIENMLPAIYKEEEKIKLRKLNDHARKHKVKSKEKWDLVADKVADFANIHLFKAHCGALLYDNNVTAVFGNFGYEAGRSQKVKNNVTRMLTMIALSKYKTLGFGLSKCKYSYCLLINSNDVHLFHDWAWLNNPFKMSKTKYQYSIASVALSSYMAKPLSDLFIN